MEWLSNHPVATVIIILGCLWVVGLWVSTRVDRKQVERDRIKQKAEDEYQNWKKERGMGNE